MQPNPYITHYIAILNDGTSREHHLADFESKFLEDIDMDKVLSFWYVNALGNRVYGVDVRNRLFLFNGCLVQIPLPEGEYRGIAVMRTLVSSVENNPKIRLFGFGLQATIDGKNVKRLCFVYPDGSVIMEK